MAAYLTYEQYHSMGGTLTEAAFPLAEMKARSIIDYYTFNRISEVIEPVQNCMMELMELAAKIERINAGDEPLQVSSETVGDHTVSYRDGLSAIGVASSSGVTRTAMEYQIVARHLMHTGLMYRGGLIC